MEEFFDDVESYSPEGSTTSPARSLEDVALDQPIESLPLREPLCLDSSRPVAEAIHMMRENRNGSVLVTEDGKLAGIFTERDVLRKLALEGAAAGDTPLRDVMREGPDTLSPDAPMAYALNLMSLGGFRHVPLVDAEGRAVGVVSVRDIVNYLVDQFPDKILNLPPRPGGDIPPTREGA